MTMGADYLYSNDAGFDSDDDNGNDLEDQHKKKKLLIKIIKKGCATSSCLMLKQIHEVINSSENGSNLKAAFISGGYTHYSFKVFVDTHPELCIFAKLSLEYGQYSLKRTENEYLIMKQISSSKGTECVVAPLACWEASHKGKKMKIIVTEWSEAGEQLSNQFMDGIVDPRVAPKIATTFAELHTIQDFDPSFNEDAKPNMDRFLSHMRMVALMATNSDEPKRRTDAYCASLGQEVVMKIIGSVLSDSGKRDCLTHSEAHVFNILVEDKPSIDLLDDFGPNGTCTIVDWEMAMAGPIGKDCGLCLAFPVGCMIAHALMGHSADANQSIESFINTLIDTYSSKMKEAGKSAEDIAAIVRNIFGWAGWFLYFAFYILDVFPFPVESEASKTRLRDALGVLGFKLMHLSYDTDYVPASATDHDLRKIFKSLWEEEVARAQDVFAAGRRRRQPRKSSIWRTTNRRLSGTEMFYLAAEKRLSVASSAGVCTKRLSVESGDIGESMKSMAREMKRMSIAGGIGESIKSIPEDILTENDVDAADQSYADFLSFLAK